MDLSFLGAVTLARIYLRSKTGRVPRLIPTHLPALRPTFLYSLHSLTSPPLTERNRQRDDSVCMRECIYVCLLSIYVHIFCSYCPFFVGCLFAQRLAQVVKVMSLETFTFPQGCAQHMVQVPSKYIINAYQIF